MCEIHVLLLFVVLFLRIYLHQSFFTFFFSFFFFNDTATTEIYTLSLHDALPIFGKHMGAVGYAYAVLESPREQEVEVRAATDRKSTRLNSSHSQISYAVFCLKKKKKKITKKKKQKKTASI